MLANCNFIPNGPLALQPTQQLPAEETLTGSEHSLQLSLITQYTKEPEGSKKSSYQIWKGPSRLSSKN